MAESGPARLFKRWHKNAFSSRCGNLDTAPQPRLPNSHSSHIEPLLCAQACSALSSGQVSQCLRRPLLVHRFDVNSIESQSEWCDANTRKKWGLGEWGIAVLFRAHTRPRIGERRREAKLSCQRLLEEMDYEHPQLEERCVENANPKDKDHVMTSRVIARSP
jgi:hypothetical protein